MAREPLTPHRIAGVKDTVFSEADRRYFEQLAEQDDWAQATDAFSPSHRPVIRQQLNPLIVQAQWLKQHPELANAAETAQMPQDLPELWVVKVPRTEYAFTPTDLLVDRLYRDQPGRGATSRGMAPRKVPQYTPDTLEDAMNAAKARWKLQTFTSAEDAERFAQETWRTYWEQHVKSMTEASREHFQKNAVINVTRERYFTVDESRPAHQLQYELFLQDHPLERGFPEGTLVDFKDSNRPRPASPRNAALAKNQQRAAEYEQFALGRLAPEDAFEFHTDADRQDWQAGESTRATAEEAMDPSQIWQIRKMGDKEFVLARQTPDSQWEFWRNATGRAVAFEAKSAQAVLKSLPKTVAATTQITEQIDAETLRKQWISARNHDYTAPTEVVNTWVEAETDVGRALTQVAQQSPLMARQVLPLLGRVDAIDQQVFPDDGLVPAQIDHTLESLDYLHKAAQRALPLSARPAVLGAIDHWRTVTGPLNTDSLGLFQYGRIPDIGFTDSRVESVAHVDGLGDWAAHRMPSGHYALARLKNDGTVSHVEIPLYRDKQAVHHRVANQGGYLTFEQNDWLAKEWVKRTEKAFGPNADRIITAALTPDAVWRDYLAREKHQDDPRPLPPVTEAPSAWNLSVTPMGNGRGLVWHTVEDPNRKEHEPELVAWRRGVLTSLNKRNHGWRLPAKDGSVPEWDTIPVEQRPWVVETGPKGSIRDMVEAVRQEMPSARVTAEPLTDPHIVEALAQRWGFQPASLRMSEGIWMVHPVPGNPDRWMLSTREWITDPKVDRPGEFIAHAAFKPYRDHQAPLGPDGYPPVTQFRTTPATLIQTLEKAGCVGQLAQSLPPESVQVVTVRDSWDTPAIDWTNRDPLVVVHRGSYELSETVLEDLQDEMEEAEVPAPRQLMMKQVYAGSRTLAPLRADDWQNTLPDAEKDAGFTWHEAESSVRQFAATWLEEHPKIAKRLLTQHVETPTAVRTPAPVAALSM